MSILVFSPQGRFGNQCVSYLFARGYAERHGMELQTPEWVGERVFQISHPRPDGRGLVRHSETDLIRIGNHKAPPGCVLGEIMDCEFRGYAQMQACCDYYTKRQAQDWLKLRPEIEASCEVSSYPIQAHRRVGDYSGYGYPVVSELSYRDACREFGLDAKCMIFRCEELPTLNSELPFDLMFVADFYKMMKAPTLLRGNSSFSWLAALLGNGLVLSPNIEGKEGGKEHFCHFEAGNHCRFANLDFVEDLHVRPI